MRGLGNFGAITPAFAAYRARSWERNLADDHPTMTFDPYPATCIETSDDSFERDVLNAIAKTRSELKLKKTTGHQERLNYASAKYERTDVPLYRLESQELRATFDFELLPRDGEQPGYVIHTKLLMIDPAVQGSFWRFRAFIKQVCAVLLEGLERHYVHSLTGRAVTNQFPVRQRKDWRDQKSKDKRTTKLMRLYQRVGGIPSPSNPGYVNLLSKRALAELKTSQSQQSHTLLVEAERMERKPRIKNPKPREELSFCI